MTVLEQRFMEQIPYLLADIRNALEKANELKQKELDLKLMNFEKVNAL